MIETALVIEWLLDRLDGNGAVEFNTFHRDGFVQPNQIQLARFRNHPRACLQNFLNWGEANGAKVSVGVNLRRVDLTPYTHHHLPYDGFGKKEDILQCAAFFVDADLNDAPVELADLIAYTPQPTLVVQSSPGKFHAYWKLSGALDIPDATTLNRYEGVQKGLANFFGFKPMNIRQVMGLPGSRNHKYDPAPVREIVFLNENNVYGDWADFPEARTHHTPIRDYGVTLHHDGKIPADAAAQLRDYMRHGGRNNAVFAVSAWLHDLGFELSTVLSFVMTETGRLPAYADVAYRDIETAVKSAFRR